MCRRAKPAFLAEKQKRLREMREGVHAVGDGFGQAAEQGKGGERDDERRQPEPGDEDRVETARQAARQQSEDRRHPDGEMRVTPKGAEEDRAQAKEGADRQINPAGEHDGRHGQRQEADLDGVANDVESIIQGPEMVAGDAEKPPFGDEDNQQNGFMAQQD